MFKFLELRNLDTFYFNTVIKYCREVFHYSIKETSALVGKLQLRDNEQVKAHVLYADCLGELVGFVIFYYLPKNKVGFVEALYILEHYQDQGIGRQLYWHMMDFLKERYPQCEGHVLEIGQDKENYLRRKAFFLKQGCIPIALDFFSLDPVVSKSGIRILYQPYRLNQVYSLKTMQEIFREMAINLVHTISVPVHFFGMDFKLIWAARR